MAGENVSEDEFVEAEPCCDHIIHAHCVHCVTPGKCKARGDTQHCAVVVCGAGGGKCTAMFHACKLQEHRELCGMAVVKCINADAGCPLLVPRSEMSSHLPHCPASVLQCSVEWNRWKGQQALRMKQPLPKALRHGQLDLALALRDQRFLDASLQLPVKKRRAMRTPQNRAHPAMPVISSIHMDVGDDGASASTSKTTTASDDSLSPWHQAHHPPGLASSVCSKLQPTIPEGPCESHVRADQGKLGHVQDDMYDTRDIRDTRDSQSQDAQDTLNTHDTQAQDAQDTLNTHDTLHTRHTQDVEDMEDIQVVEDPGDIQDTCDVHDICDLQCGSCKSERKNIILTPQEGGNVYEKEREKGNSTIFTSFINMMVKGGSNSGSGSSSSPSAAVSSTKGTEMCVDGLVLSPALQNQLYGGGVVGVDTCVLCAQNEFCKQQGPVYENGLCYGHGGCNRYKDYINPVMDRGMDVDADEQDKPETDTDVAASQSGSDLNLGLDLMIEAITRYQTKPRSMYTFLCAQNFRRDEYCWHYKHVHSDIHGGLNGWLEQRCPLYSYGCSFSSMRFSPNTEKGLISHNDLLESFAILPNCEENDGDGTDYLSQLPIELVMLIAERYLDAFSLNNLSMVSHLFRQVCESLLDTRGMVVWHWQRVKLEGGGCSWQRAYKQWSFSTNFSEVKHWHMDARHTGRVSRHLHECASNTVFRRTLPFSYMHPTDIDGDADGNGLGSNSKFHRLVEMHNLNACHTSSIVDGSPLARRMSQ